MARWFTNVSLPSCVIALVVLSTPSSFACPPPCLCFNEGIFDCSEAQLNDVPEIPKNTTVVILNGNPLLNGKRFPNFTGILEIDLSRTSSQFIQSSISSLPSSLRVLDLSINNLEDTDLTYLQNLPNLSYLNISYNKFQVLDLRSFSPSLKGLQVHDNDIKQVLWEVDRLPALETLNLSKNEKITDVSFLQALPSLKQLDLSGTGITEIPRNLNLSELQSLELSNTKQMHQLNKEHFAFFPKLTTLSIQSSGLQVIHKWTFAALTSLKFLTVTNNTGLHEVDDTAFAEGLDLYSLDLSFNNLSEVPYGLSRIKVRYLNMRGNPFLCDCHSLWLKQWMIHDEQKKHLVFLHSRQTVCANFKEDPVTLLEGLRRTVCQRVEVHNVTITPNPIKLDGEAFLSCNVSGYPTPSITWITPRNLVFHWQPSNVTNLHIPFPSHPAAHDRQMRSQPSDRHKVLENGTLHIIRVTKDDTGVYRCYVTNSISETTSTAELFLDGNQIRVIWLQSVFFGLSVALATLLGTLLFHGIRVLIDRFGCCCPDVTPRARKVRQALIGIEQYRVQQMEWIREGYNLQAQRVKDNCVAQLEKIRDSYTNQMKNVKAIRNYGSSQLGQMRDSYYDQCKRVKDYSMQQMGKARDNYVTRRSRVLKYSASQLEKIRETYKLHHKTFNKIMENLSSMNYLEHCKKGEGDDGTVSLEDFRINVEDDAREAADDDPIPEDPVKSLWEIYLSQIPRQIFRMDDIDEIPSSSEYFTPESSPQKKKRALPFRRESGSKQCKKHRRKGTLGSLKSFWSTTSGSTDSLPREAAATRKKKRSLIKVQVAAEVFHDLIVEPVPLGKREDDAPPPPSPTEHSHTSLHHPC